MAIPADATLSQEMYEFFTKNLNWDLPEIDFSGDGYKLPDGLLDALKKAPENLTNASFTNTVFKDTGVEKGIVKGTGTLDAVLESLKAHLRVEHDAQRIDGTNYAQAYVQMMQVGVQASVTFLVQRDKAYWEAVKAQIDAATAAIGLEAQKMQYVLAKFQARLLQAQYANEVMKLSLQDAQYLNTSEQTKLVTKQIGSLTLKDTLDTNKDSRETKLVNKQIDLYSQQIESFKRKDERETVKMQADTLVARLGVDDGTVVPDVFANPSLQTTYTNALKKVGLT